MNQTSWIIYQAVWYFIQVLGWAIIIDMLLSWVLPPTHQIRRVIGRLVGPLLTPFRGLSQKIMMKTHLPLDLSPLMAYICLQILLYLVQYIFVWFVFT